MNTRTIVDRGFAGLWGRHSQYFGRSQDEATGPVPLKSYTIATERARRFVAETVQKAHREERDAALVRAIGRAFG